MQFTGLKTIEWLINVKNKGNIIFDIYYIAGLLIIEYVPELKVLEQLELFGALPVIDFITDVNFRDDRKDYIVAGNTFGELSILTKRPYSCHVVADSACEVLFIPEESIRKAMIMDNDPIKG